MNREKKDAIRHDWPFRATTRGARLLVILLVVWCSSMATLGEESAMRNQLDGMNATKLEAIAATVTRLRDGETDSPRLAALHGIGHEALWSKSLRGETEEGLEVQVGRLVEQSVLEANAIISAEDTRSTRVDLTKGQQLAMLERTFDTPVVNPLHKLGPLTVRVWITDSSIDGTTLYWLRSGAHREAERLRADSRVREVDDCASPCARMYSLRTLTLMHQPLCAEEGASTGSRVGYLAGNVLIELSRDTYQRRRPDAPWCTLGIDAEDASVLHAVAMDLLQRIADSQED